MEFPQVQHTDETVDAAVMMQRDGTNHPDSSDATTGASDTGVPDDRGGPTGARLHHSDSDCGHPSATDRGGADR